jgi:hypothetical protein
MRFMSGVGVPNQASQPGVRVKAVAAGIARTTGASGLSTRPAAIRSTAPRKRPPASSFAVTPRISSVPA